MGKVQALHALRSIVFLGEFAHQDVDRDGLGQFIQAPNFDIWLAATAAGVEKCLGSKTISERHPGSAKGNCGRNVGNDGCLAEFRTRNPHPPDRESGDDPSKTAESTAFSDNLTLRLHGRVRPSLFGHSQDACLAACPD